MKFDFEKYGFYYEESNPFFGKCWLSNKKFTKESINTFYSGNYDTELFVYIQSMDKLFNRKTSASIKINDSLEIEIINFLNAEQGL